MGETLKNRGLLNHPSHKDNEHMHAELFQLGPTLCDSMEQSPPVYSVLGFSRKKYWNGLPCLSSGDLPNPRIKPRTSVLQADSLPWGCSVRHDLVIELQQ